ncbi:glycosyltransferase [Bacteroides sp. Marseille-P3684]
MEKSKVSVIIPVYNVASYIERCACSLLGQALREMEFVFVDDSSPDRYC